MKYTVKQYPDLLEKVEGMCVEDLLRAVICPNYNVAKRTPVRNTTSVFVHPTTVEIAKPVLEALNEERAERALAATDMEYGAGKMIQGAVRFPSMRAVAETGDESLAYEMGLHTAAEAIRAGYQWNFSPCVDILQNRRNPIVSIRTAGEDADTVLRYGGAYMRGLQEGGLVATLKHFPGDGPSFDDQHVTTTENDLSREEWDASFGRIYSTLIEEGAKAIMPGHISLPAYDEIDEETGYYPPATLSKRLMTDLLRGQLGFEGIIISDATGMSGFCGYINLYRACARFLEAGGDCLLFVHENEMFMDEMKALISTGELTMETLRNRAYRMLCFSREQFEIVDRRKAGSFDRAAAERCAEQVTRKSLRVVRDKAGLLPFSISKETKIAHVPLANLGTPPAALAVADDLTEQLRRIAGTVDVYADPGPEKLKTLARDGDYDLIICTVSNEMSYGLNTVKLTGPIARNMMQGWMRYKTPVLFISYYDPYFGEDYKTVTDTLINTYGYSAFTNAVLLETICGKSIPKA